jgi:hypothetical protein
MSYSFQVKSASANKSHVKALVAIKLAEVVVAQPEHAHDAHQAQAAANAYIDLLQVEESHGIYVSVNGSLQRFYDNDGKPQFVSTSVGIQAAQYVIE